MKHKLILFASILSLTFVAAPNANAQWVLTNGPGYINCLAVNGTNFFAGTNDSGVFLSTDNGTSWKVAGLTNHQISALVVSSSNLLAATYTNQGSDVFLSTNNGTSWVPANNGFPPSAEILDFGVKDSSLFAGTFGNGVFLSTDHGANWTAINNGFPFDSAQVDYPNVLALAMSGTNLFAGTTARGVYRSTDNGTSWTEVNNGLSNYVTQYADAFAIIGSNLFLGIHASAGTPGGGVHRSTDNGASWTDASSGLTSPYIDDLAVSGTNFFAGTYDDGVFLSTDSGTSWAAVNTGLTNLTIGVKALAVIGTNLFAGTSGNGVWRRPLSEMTNQAQAASDTQSVLFSGAGTMNVTLSGDSARYRAHRIDFVNNSSVAFVVAKAALTSTNNRFSISQLLPGVPDTVQPGAKFSMIVRFLGDTSGTVYQDTVVLTIDHALTSFYVYLNGHSFASPKSGVSQNSNAADFRISPNPFSNSTTVHYSSLESSHTQVSIINLLGSEVAQLFTGTLDGGEHSFTWDVRGMPPGMYICIIRASGHTEELPIMLVK